MKYKAPFLFSAFVLLGLTLFFINSYIHINTTNTKRISERITSNELSKLKKTTSDFPDYIYGKAWSYCLNSASSSTMRTLTFLSSDKINISLSHYKDSFCKKPKLLNGKIDHESYTVSISETFNEYPEGDLISKQTNYFLDRNNHNVYYIVFMDTKNSNEFQVSFPKLIHRDETEGVTMKENLSPSYYTIHEKD